MLFCGITFHKTGYYVPSPPPPQYLYCFCPIYFPSLKFYIIILKYIVIIPQFVFMEQ